MSSDAPDAAAFYFQFKLTVYDNLFVGIVYGEGQDTGRWYSSFLSTLPRRCLYRILRYLGPHPPVSFTCAFEGRTMHG